MLGRGREWLWLWGSSPTLSLLPVEAESGSCRSSSHNISSVSEAGREPSEGRRSSTSRGRAGVSVGIPLLSPCITQWWWIFWTILQKLLTLVLVRYSPESVVANCSWGLCEVYSWALGHILEVLMRRVSLFAALLHLPPLPHWRDLQKPHTEASSGNSAKSTGSQSTQTWMFITLQKLQF